MRPERSLPGSPSAWLSTLFLLAATAARILHVAWQFERHALSDLDFYDQTVFEQCLRGIIAGDGPSSPFEWPRIGTTGTSHNALHFQPVLYLLAPLYALLPSGLATENVLWSTLGLKLIEMILVLSAAYPLGRLAKSIISRNEPSKFATVTILLGGLLFLCDWPLLVQLTRDFHPINLAIPGYAWGLWLLSKKRWRFGTFVVLSALLTKETEVITIALLGLVTLLPTRRWFPVEIPRAVAATLLAVSLAWGAAYFAIIQPNATPEGQFHFSNAFTRTPELGFTEGMIDWLQHPDALAERLLTFENRDYLWGQYARLGFLPLLQPVACIPVVSGLAPSLLSRHAIHKQLGERYFSGVLIFHYVALFAAIGWLSKVIAKRTQLYENQLSAGILGTLVAVNAILSFGIPGHAVDPYPAPHPLRPWSRQHVAAIVEPHLRTDDIIACDWFANPYLFASYPNMREFPYQPGFVDRAEPLDAYIIRVGGVNERNKQWIMNLYRHGYMSVGETWKAGLPVFRQTFDGNNSFLRIMADAQRVGPPWWLAQKCTGIYRTGNHDQAQFFVGGTVQVPVAVLPQSADSTASIHIEISVTVASGSSPMSYRFQCNEQETASSSGTLVGDMYTISETIDPGLLRDGMNALRVQFFRDDTSIADHELIGQLEKLTVTLEE